MTLKNRYIKKGACRVCKNKVKKDLKLLIRKKIIKRRVSLRSPLSVLERNRTNNTSVVPFAFGETTALAHTPQPSTSSTT